MVPKRISAPAKGATWDGIVSFPLFSPLGLAPSSPIPRGLLALRMFPQTQLFNQERAPKIRGLGFFFYLKKKAPVQAVQARRFHTDSSARRDSDFES